MVEFERLKATAEQLIARLSEGGLTALDEALNTSKWTAATYRYSYDRYLQYFRDKPAGDSLSELDLFIGFAMAYSWMATMKHLDPRIDTLQATAQSLNRIRGMDALEQDADALETLLEPIRQFIGSVVGTSKLLHFVNPEVFPIWDSVVQRYFARVKWRAASDSLGRYLEFTQNVHELIRHPQFDTVIYAPLSLALDSAHEQVSDQYRKPNPMGKVRTAEFVMFFGGRVEHQTSPIHYKSGSRN